jgi:diguanylate cyclase (GGDEF)-like protein
VLGRYGGEEFCAVLLGADQAGAFAVAERIRLAVQQAEVPLASGHIHVTVSIGVATAGSESPETFDSLLQRADRAMYSAKAAGRDCVRLHEG